MQARVSRAWRGVDVSHISRGLPLSCPLADQELHTVLLGMEIMQVLQQKTHGVLSR